MNRRRQAAVGAWLLVVVAGTGAGAQELSFEERVAARERLERVYLRYRTGTTSGQTPSRERLETMVRQQIARSTFVDTQRPGLISHGEMVEPSPVASSPKGGGATQMISALAEPATSNSSGNRPNRM